MISVTKAKKILSGYFREGKIKKVVLGESLGLVAAQDIYSPIDVPSFDNSAMDGYAMEFDGTRREWEIEGLIQAGDISKKSVAPGKAARIFTGAKMPQGADTVIPQELVSIEKKNIRYDQHKIKTGSNVRLKGSQCRKGNIILEKGSRISPGIVGLLASVGLAEIDVYVPPSVAYVITGDELKEVGSKLKEGEIYNSNGPMLEALLNQVGIKEISAYKAGDKKEELQQTIDKALQQHDVLLLSGGISVGDYDFVKECLENSGVEELFYKLKQRPGKPVFAGRKNKKCIFALPGNPASVHSCFVQYVKPCLFQLMGYTKVWKPDTVLPLLEDTRKKRGFTFFMKAQRTGNGVKILTGQQSFNLQAFNKADALVELEEEKEFIKAGTPVNVYYI